MVGAGTPAYMAPEQVKGLDPVPQTDIYALGIILYEMLTGGERPFTGERATTTGTTSAKVRWEQVNTQPLPPSNHNHRISVNIDALVIKCLEKNPSNRYSSSMQLINELNLNVGGDLGNLNLPDNQGEGKNKKNNASQNKGKKSKTIDSSSKKPQNLWGQWGKLFFAGSLLILTILIINEFSGMTFVIEDPIITTTESSTITVTETIVPPTKTPIPTSTQTAIPEEHTWAYSILALVENKSPDEFYDFDEGFGPWAAHGPGYRGFYYEDGVYRWKNEIFGKYFWENGPWYPSNFVWQFDLLFTNESGQDPRFGAAVNAPGSCRIYFDKFQRQIRIEYGEPEVRKYSHSLPQDMWPSNRWQTISIISINKNIAVAVGGEVVNVAKCESLSGYGTGTLNYSGHNKIQIDIDNVNLWDISNLKEFYSFED